MIAFEPTSNGTCWLGSDWSVTDEEELATLIARVALGQYRYVLKVLDETNCIPQVPVQSALEGAIHLLTARDPDQPWHRDGWLFQVISWIAANLENPDAIKSPPQMSHADKGFDGLHLYLDDSKEKVLLVVICEDKATDNPRGKITGQVWPEFRNIDEGVRDNELVSHTTTLLALNGHIDPDQAVHEILWKQSRGYRVAITISDKENSDAGRNALFKDYENTVSTTDVEKRRADTFHKNNLRQWMQQIADKAIDAAKELVSANV